MEIFTSYQKERAMTRARMFGAHRAALQTGIPAETIAGWMQDASEESTSKGEKKASAKIIRKKSVSPKKKVIGNAKAAKKEKNEQAEARFTEMTTTRSGRKAKEPTKTESVTESKQTGTGRKAKEQAKTESVAESKRTGTGQKTKKKITEAQTGKGQLNGINIVIQSNSGKMISASKICKKVPDNTELVYAKPEEGKLYYVLKDGSKGSTELWEE